MREENLIDRRGRPAEVPGQRAEGNALAHFVVNQRVIFVNAATGYQRAQMVSGNACQVLDPPTRDQDTIHVSIGLRMKYHH